MELAIPVILFHLAAMPALAAETSVQIGDTSLAVPTPEGFAPVTKDMAALDRRMEAFVAPMNVRFISFIPVSAVPAVRRGEIPDLPRSLTLQTTKSVTDRFLTKADFKNLKLTVQKQNAELLKEAERQMPGLLEKATRKIAGETGEKLAMNINGLVPLPPHEDGERALAYSTLLKLTVQGPDGQTETVPGVVTATFLHAKGKLFFTYVYGGDGDLEWTRQTAKNWTAAILAANPSDAATLEKESRSNNFLSNPIMLPALIGAIVGVAITLLRNRSKKQPPA